MEGRNSRLAPPLTAEQHIQQLEARLVELEEELKNTKEQLALVNERLWCPDCDLPRGGMLSDQDIKRLVQKGRIGITPQPDLETAKVLGTCKIDLHLGEEAKTLKSERVPFVDINKKLPDDCFNTIDIQREGPISIAPNQLVIAVVLERLTLPNDITGMLLGKSSVARKGGSVEAAPIFDAGWDGKPMLELHNIGSVPFMVHYGAPICAMSFFHLTSPALQPYATRDGTRYRVQVNAQI